MDHRKKCFRTQKSLCFDLSQRTCLNNFNNIRWLKYLSNMDRFIHSEPNIKYGTETEQKYPKELRLIPMRQSKMCMSCITIGQMKKKTITVTVLTQLMENTFLWISHIPHNCLDIKKNPNFSNRNTCKNEENVPKSYVNKNYLTVI